MEWTDLGIVLAVRKHGESSVIATLLTEHYGRHAGLVRGGAGRRHRGALQVGNRLRVTWRARLPEHLGHFNCELAYARTATVLADKRRLAGLSAAAAVLERSLPEREPQPGIYAAFDDLLDAIVGSVHWPETYVVWEVELLRELGFGLDLTRCALTDRTDDLAYVSPRSGRAVSRDAAGDYRNRLLPLPAFLTQAEAADEPASAADISAGLSLTGYFLEHHVFLPSNTRLPAARLRLLDIFQRDTTKSSNIRPR